MASIQFTAEDFRTPASTERAMRRFERAMSEQVTAATKLPSAQELAALLAPSIRDALQVNGSAPLNLQGLLFPGQAQPVFIEDTHANRLALYAAGGQQIGTAFLETDRNVIYIANSLLAWTYAAGAYLAPIASRPADLGTESAGFLFYATDESNSYRWTGAAWATIANRILIGGFYGIFTHANSADRTYTLPDETGNVAYATAALTSNALLLGGGTAKAAPMASLGTTTTVLHGNAGGAPTFAAVSLTADVSGTLPAGNGGTGVAYNRISDTIAATGQTAAIASTNFANASTAGTYRVSYSLQDTAADVTAGTIQLTVAFTDGAGATTVSSAALALTAVGRTTGVFFVQLASGAISYSTTLVGIIGTATYALYISLERLS